MIRHLLVAAALAPALLLAGPAGAAQTKQKAVKDPACHPARWSLTLPAGSANANADFVNGTVDHIWRVGAGAVPAGATLIIETKNANGTKGQLVLPSNGAQLVNGAVVGVSLQRGDAKSGAIAVGGTYQIQCK